MKHERIISETPERAEFLPTLSEAREARMWSRRLEHAHKLTRRSRLARLKKALDAHRRHGDGRLLARWLAEYDRALATELAFVTVPLPTASESTVPMVRS